MSEFVDHLISEYDIICSKKITVNPLELIFLYMSSAYKSKKPEVQKLQDFLEKIIFQGADLAHFRDEVNRVRVFSKQNQNFKNSKVEDHFLFSQGAYQKFISSKHFARYLLEIFSRDVIFQRASSNILVFCKLENRIFMEMCWVVELLAYEFMQQPQVVKGFLCSQNFDLLVRILAVFEGIYSTKSSYLLEENDLYAKSNYFTIYHDFNFFANFFVKGLYSLKHSDHRRVAEKSLLEALLVSEWVCEKLQEERPLILRDRLHMNCKLYAILTFLANFTLLENGGLRLLRHNYLAVFPAQKSQKHAQFRELLRYLLDNMIYYLKCQFCPSKNFGFASKYYEIYSIFNVNVVIVKSVLKARPELRKFVISHVLEQIKTDFFGSSFLHCNSRFRFSLLHFLYSLFFEDIRLEKFFLCLGYEILRRNRMFLPEKQVEALIKQCDNIMKICEVNILLQESILFQSFKDCIEINIFDLNIEKKCFHLKHVIMQQFCSFDYANFKKVLHPRFAQVDQVFLYHNFFFFNQNTIQGICRQNRSNPKLSPESRRVYIPRNNRENSIFEEFTDDFLTQMLVLFDNFQSTFFDYESDFKTNEFFTKNMKSNLDLLVEFVLIVSSSSQSEIPKNDILPDFIRKQQKVYEKYPELLELLKPIEDYISERDSVEETSAQLEPKTDKKDLKKRQSKILRKIHKKMNRHKPKKTQKRSVIKCIICHEAFNCISESFLIAKYIETNNANLIRGTRQECDKFRMFSTCGHYYHYKCLPISNYYRGIKCQFCKNLGHIFMGGFSMLQSPRPGPISAHEHVKTLKEMDEKMLIQLTMLKEDPPNVVFDIFDQLVMPVTQPIKLINTFNWDIFQRTLIPCLQRMVNLIHNVFLTNPELSLSIVSLCQKSLEEKQRVYGSFQDAEALVQSFDLSDKKYQICVEELLVDILVFYYVVFVHACLSNLDRNETNADIKGLAKTTLEKVLVDVLPWFLLLKKLQNDPQNERTLNFAVVGKSYSSLIKILNILFCVVKFDDIKFSRKSTWKNLNGTSKFFLIARFIKFKYPSTCQACAEQTQIHFCRIESI